MAVEVDLWSVRRAWDRAEGTEFWLELRSADASIEAFERALEAVGELEPHEGAFAQFVAAGPQGPVAMVDGVRDEVHLCSWLDALAGACGRVGLEGALRGTRSAHYPGWLEPGGREPTAYVAWTMDPARVASASLPTLGWMVPEQATTRIAAQSSRWARPGGPRILFFHELFGMRLADPDAVGPALEVAVRSAGSAAVWFHDDRRRRAREVTLGPGGHSTFQIIAGPEAWEARVDAVREAMVALPELVETACVRPASQLAIGWVYVASGQRFDGIEEPDVRMHPHLLDRWVPDAHGVMVLRDAHLERLGRLDDWTVTDLGHGRHLVEHHDLAAWYAGPLPEPEVVARSRDDLRPILLTKDVCAAHPGPWHRPR